MLAILRGSLLLEKREKKEGRLLPGKGSDTEFLRPTHDFARRIMADGFKGDEEIEEAREILKEDAQIALRGLLQGLESPVPGRRSDQVDWRKVHFYPYPADFIHYDALHRYKVISIERDSYRGGGGLAHRILREDADSGRLERIRSGFRKLLDDSEGPLSKLAQALLSHDKAKGTIGDPFLDQVESNKSTVLESPWVDEIRSGIDNVLRSSVPNSKKIEALMYWTPFCLIRHQLYLARERLEPGSAKIYGKIVVDCQPSNNKVRDRARLDFKHAGAAIVSACEHEAKDWQMDGESDKWMMSARGFFTSTAYAVGLSNANSGVRHFTLKPALLEAIVLAKVPSQMKFERFCSEVLCDGLGIIADADGAKKYSIDDIDLSEFGENTERLSETLHELGLLERYSDQTRMVGVVK
jgi:hypothetical protein